MSGERLLDPAMTDRTWLGYHPRAMAPVVLVTAIISLLVWTGKWYLDGILELAEVLGSWALFGLAWGVWPAITAIFLYRTITYTYRLTDRTVLVDFGPLFLPVSPIPLAEITEVVVSTPWLARWLGVGAVELRLPNRVVRLKGIRHPTRLAEIVRAAILEASR